MSVTTSCQLSLTRSVADNCRLLGEFLAKAMLATPSLSTSRAPVVSFLTMPPLAASTHNAHAPVSAILEQAHALYETSVKIDPFLNTIVVPAFFEEENQAGAAAVVPPPPRSFLAADLHKMADDKFPVFEYVALGGTFDRLHPGHKMLLTQAALCTAAKLRVGITGPLLLKNKKNAEMLQSFDDRREAARQFLSTLRSDLELELVELTEKSGGTNSIAEVSAMVVSPETLPSLESINEERKEKGFKPMAAVPIAFVGGSDNASRMSSSRLREMEMQRNSDSDSSPK